VVNLLINKLTVSLVLPVRLGLQYRYASASDNSMKFYLVLGSPPISRSRRGRSKKRVVCTCARARAPVCVCVVDKEGSPTPRQGGGRFVWSAPTEGIQDERALSRHVSNTHENCLLFMCTANKSHK
jgi:hypothetical protein